jgi:hypothetical protein
VIRKLKSGEYRIYSRKKNPATGKRRNLGTFKTLEAGHTQSDQADDKLHIILVNNPKYSEIPLC